MNRQEKKPRLLFLLTLAAMAVLMVVFGAAFALLTQANREYTRLNIEREASLAVAILWDNYTQAARNNQDADRRRPLWRLENETENLNDYPQLLQRLKGFALLGPGGRLFVERGFFPEEVRTLILQPEKLLVLPFGDRALHLENGGILYLRPLQMRIRGTLSPQSRNPPRSLAVYYDGSVLYQAGTLRQVFLAALIFGAVGLCGFLFFLLLRTQDLRSRLDKQENLASLGAAARTLAHEIRNPLSILLMQKSLLQRKLPEEFQEALDRIGKEAERINQLTTGVRNMLARPRGQAVQIEIKNFVEGLLAEQEAWKGKVELTAPAVEVKVFFDFGHLRSILVNLVQNALEAGPEGPVKIGWRRPREGFPPRKDQRVLELAVEDEAGGIDKKIRQKIFDPFFSTKQGGSGVGLSLSRQLARAGGGDLLQRNTRSRGAAGSLFLLRLPTPAIEGDTK